jgi:signal transduction histidine kinase/HAMP domain-containing protein
MSAALAAGAPVCGARPLPLRIRADHGAAAAARPARTPVDVAQDARALDARAHLHVRRFEHRRQLLVAHVGERPPRRDASVPQRLRLPDVPDAGHEPLIEHSVADVAVLRRGAEALEHRVEIRWAREDVRAKASAHEGAAPELEHGAVPEHGLVRVAAQHEPGAPDPPRATRLDAPAARHAQVAAQHEPALEVQQEVLPDGLDRLEHAPVQPLRELHSGGPGMGRLDLDPLPREHLEPAGRPMERVSLWHGRSVEVPKGPTIPSMPRRFAGIRWWLSVAFAVVAAVSTALVVSQFSTRSQNAFRDRAQELALNSAVVAASEIGVASRNGRLTQALPSIANRQNLELHVFDPHGVELGTGTPRGGNVHEVSLEHAALVVGLRGDRYRGSTSDGRVFIAGVPLRGEGLGALVALDVRPDVAAAIGIVSDQALRAGVIAGVIGVLVGLLLAQLIALRLRRLSAAAEAMALGDFESPMRYRYRDEFGALAQSFERMRRQLRRSFRQIEGERDRLRMLLERLHEGVVTVDADLVVQFANAEARRLLGGRLTEGDALPDPWLGFPLRDFALTLFDPEATLAQAHVTPDEERALALVGIPAQPEGDTVLIVLDDLTEQERRELAEREFVSNAAHELRTPLTTIIGAVEVLQAGAKDDPAERDRFLAHIERESARLARLARALLTLARAHAGQERPRSEPIALRPLLQEVADDLRPSVGVTVGIECPPELGAVVNRDLLEQVLRNLGENATKHTQEGRVVLRAYSAGNTLRLEVEDTGVGMTSETQRHVFDRFYRGRDRDAEGFGLGLAIVRQTVRSLDGRIELDSAPGKGTRVRVVLEQAPMREAVPVA